MKKTALCCLLAASAAGALWAASDKIYIIEGGYLSKLLNVDEIDAMYYSKDTDGNRYHNLEVNFKNGTVKTLPLAPMQGMQWHKSLRDCPVTVDIMPRHQSAQLTCSTDDPNVYYRITGMPEKDLIKAGIDESVWAETLMDADIDYMYSVAAYYDVPLSHFKLETIFEKGAQVRDWFPDRVISDNTPIALVVYSAELQGDEVVPTSEPTLMRFTTLKLDIEDVAFDLSADMTSNTMIVKADAPEEWGDKPFYVTAYSEDQIERDGLDLLIYQSVYNLEKAVYNYGRSWDEVTFRGHGENKLSNLLTGDVYHAVAFGLDYGIVTTVVKTKEFTVPAPVITDNCTFEVEAVQKSPSEFSLAVTPSDPSTRYAGLLVETSKFNDEYTPSMAIARDIKYRNSTGTVNWADSKFVFTGESVLSTHDHLFEGKYLSVGTEYSVLLYGVDEIGTRTTEIKRVDITPQSVQKDETVFDVSFSDFDGSSIHSHMLTVNVNPSDPEAKYVIEYLPADNPYVDMSRPDDQIMSEYVRVQGEYLKLYQGQQSKKMSFSVKHDPTLGVNVFKEYILMIFGYDGESTTPLYAWSIDSDTGETTQIRGPKDNTLTFTLKPGKLDTSSSKDHYLPMTVTASDPDARFVFNYLPVSIWSIDLSKTDEEIIRDYVEVEGRNLDLFTGEETRIMAMGSEWDSALGLYMFKDFYMFVFGYDGEATSPLYMFRVSSEDGSIEQVRGPEVEIQHVN